jgi:hypothetical protein
MSTVKAHAQLRPHSLLIASIPSRPSHRRRAPSPSSLARYLIGSSTEPHSSFRWSRRNRKVSGASGRGRASAANSSDLAPAPDPFRRSGGTGVFRVFGVRPTAAALITASLALIAGRSSTNAIGGASLGTWPPCLQPSAGHAADSARDRVGAQCRDNSLSFLLFSD